MKFVIIDPYNAMYYGRYERATFNCKTEAEISMSEFGKPHFFKVHPWLEFKGEFKSCNDA